MHGDTLCTKDVGYQKFRKKSRSWWWQAIIKSLPLFVRRRIAENYRKKSASATKEKTVAPKKTTKKSVVSINFDSWNKQVKGNTKKPILDQGEGAGLLLPYSCRGGMCGRCKIKLERSEVRHLADDALSDEDKKQGYVLACSAVPQTDIVLSKP